ncbi:MAG: radical SAM protein [Muribaculaceae bacterium]|nr:radical SAM protein [Muribaculaceae bacterium]
MQTVLFTSTIFGPIHSRRLGTSLGVNLMPADGKVCSFDCLYCEAGFNAQGPGTKGIPPREEVARLLEEKLREMRAEDMPLDVITFSGNGEPTLHPDFNGVVDDVTRLRDRYYPEAKVSVLSNATRLRTGQVVEGLRKVDNNILKLDSAIDDTVNVIDRPVGKGYSVADVVEGMKQFDGQCIVQTMMLRGEHDGKTIDNTTDEEIEALIKAYKDINPREVMLYSIDRKTPAEQLVKVEREELEYIAERFRREGIRVAVS